MEVSFGEWWKGGEARLTHEIEGPIGGRTDGRSFGSHTERVDLDWVQPGNALPANTKEDIVQEEKGN